MSVLVSGNPPGCGGASTKPIFHNALQKWEVSIQEGVSVGRDGILAILQEGMVFRDLAYARKLHVLMTVGGVDSEPVLGNHLIRLFSACRSLADASQVFIRVICPNVYTWNAIISAEATLGDKENAFNLFAMMLRMDVVPNRVTFLVVLKVCHELGAITKGNLFHNQINVTVTTCDAIIANTLIDMYAKCGCLDDAYAIFKRTVFRDVVTWGIMISGYAQHGFGKSAIKLFGRMKRRGIIPDKVTFLSTLKACGDIKAVGHGRQFHEQIVKFGYDCDVVISTAIVVMYCNFGSLMEAEKQFDSLLEPNVVSWGALISGYVQQGCYEAALNAFVNMERKGKLPDALTFLYVLKACGCLRAIMQGRIIHDQVNQNVLDSNEEVGAALVDFYVKCGTLEEAQFTFGKLSIKTTIAWSSIISGHVEQGHDIPALCLFETMLNCNHCPCESAFLSAMRACGTLCAIEQGRLIHDKLVRAGLSLGDFIRSSIIDMYARCGSLDEAHKLFDQLPEQNKVSWCALISGYLQHGNAAFAMELFKKMLENDLQPDAVTILCVLKACASIKSLEQCKIIHRVIGQSELLSNVLIGNMIVDTYVKCGSLKEAHSVFDKLPRKTVVSWTALIAGYVDHGYSITALELFSRMRFDNVDPNCVTYLHLLKACGNIGAIRSGRLIHDQLIRSGLELTLSLGSALLDMYAKCGSLSEAQKVFGYLPSQDSISWGSLIAGYAQHLECELAIKSIQSMQKEGLRPTHATFTSILAACSNAGLVREGWHYFNLMTNVYAHDPSMEHYSCMTDLLGRVGCLEDAGLLVQNVSTHPTNVLWTSLLTSCKTYGNTDLGLKYYKEAVRLNPDDASAYSLASSMCGDV